MTWTSVQALLATLLMPGALGGQTAATVNIYRFILGVDVPESPAFVVMGVAPTRVLLGSAPKPVGAAVLDGLPGGTAPGVALDVAPAFLTGAGVRRVARWRSMSLGGRLARVLTKTVVSVGAVRDPGDATASLVGMALRSTVHDPHDPTLSSTLAEEVAAELARHGIPDAAGADPDVSDRGADLAPLYARARRAMRGRSGDVQLSAGWGVAGRLRGGVLQGDSLETVRHTVWLSGQFTASPRLDVLATLQARSAFRADVRVWIGGALLRKSATLDSRAEVYYDTRGRGVHPGVLVQARVLPTLGLAGGLASQPVDFAGVGPRRLTVRTLVHWFYASDR